MKSEAVRKKHKEIHKDKQIFYISDDPIYHKGLQLMLKSSMQKWQEASEGMHSTFSREKYLKLETDKEKQRFLKLALSNIVRDMETLRNLNALIGGSHPSPLEKLKNIKSFTLRLQKKFKESGSITELADEFFDVIRDNNLSEPTKKPHSQKWGSL